MTKKNYSEKALIKKTLKMHEESFSRRKVDEDVRDGAVPAYHLDRENTTRASVLNNTTKQMRKEKAGKWEVPVSTQWKRMVTKATFVGPGFTRKPPKYDRFFRPSGLRFTKAHVIHPELVCSFWLEIIGIKKNRPNVHFTWCHDQRNNHRG